MTWLSTLIDNEKAKGMTVYYTSWIESIKSIPAVDVV